MSPILFFIIFFYLHRCRKNIFTNKFSSSGIIDILIAAWEGLKSYREITVNDKIQIITVFDVYWHLGASYNEDIMFLWWYTW